jgi:tetratricopeptide (TPR) repeat protein
VSLINLGYLYQRQGRYAEAEPLIQRSMAIWQKALGPEHPQLALSFHSLAELYREQLRYGEAELLHMRALSIREKTLGPAHWGAIQSLTQLAELYSNQHRTDKEQRVLEEILSRLEKSVGRDHPDLIQPLYDYVFSLRMNGKYHDARRVEDQAGAILAAHYGNPKQGENNRWIRRIIFEGNNNMADKDLVNILATRVVSDDKFGFHSNYDADRLLYDREILRSYYFTNGYADFKVLGFYDLEPPGNSGGVDIKFIIEEGERYRFGNIDLIVRSEDVDRESLLVSLRTTPGNLYNARKVEETRFALQDQMKGLGNLSAKISLKVTRDAKNQLINLTYEVE